MSSVAVLTQESFAEHRSGLTQQQVKGEKTAEFLCWASKCRQDSLLLQCSLKASDSLQACRSCLLHSCMGGSPHALAFHSWQHHAEPGGSKPQIFVQL